MAKQAQIIQLRRHARPKPPDDLLEPAASGRFLPAPALADWLRAVFIDEGGPLHNPEHQHLQAAEIGVLWTNVGNSRQGRRIIGQAELGEPQGATGKWAKARARQQVEEWFGHVPTFIITVDAVYASECDDASWCALLEHEMLHCGQARDLFGQPKFTKAGRPAFAMRGHCVEEFVSVVRRYGASATGTAALVEAANRGPEIALARIAQACGTCLGKRAA